MVENDRTRRTKERYTIFSICLVLAIVLLSFFIPISVVAQENQNQTTTQTTLDQTKQDATKGRLTADQIKEQFFFGMKKLGTEVIPAKYGLDQQPAKQTESSKFVDQPTTSQPKTTEAGKFVKTPVSDYGDEYIIYPEDAPMVVSKDANQMYYATKPTKTTTGLTITPTYAPAPKITPVVIPTVSQVQPPTSQPNINTGITSNITAIGGADTVLGSSLQGLSVFAKEATKTVVDHKEILYLLLILFVSAIVAQIGGSRIGFISLLAMMALAAGIQGAAGISILPTYVIFVVIIIAIALVIMAFTRVVQE